ncbi:MAG: TatD family hydrolase [Chromatiaceae bacterium]|nr:TatD family hydrolase [Gammaproteobacteria bacterium]MCB1879078.1 TatD family hydrolase [Gammaproteobacteria bacterium]MCP5447981.1 TatD family hydrolase [Chromatiaceae bacterium]
MHLIDTHCHFDDSRFDSDRAQVYQRARAAGVAALIVPAVTRDTWDRQTAVCREYPGLYPAYGLHPMFMPQHRENHIEALAIQLASEKAVAVGECGLDFYIKDPERERQMELFHAQLKLAEKHMLPVIIHARKAVEEVINSLRRCNRLRGVLHSYAGSEQQAQRLIEMGFLLSFGGPVTYPAAKRLRQLVSRLPLDAIMLESDAPDQPDVENRGGRNEPALLGSVLNCMSELRKESAEEIAFQTTANALKLFNIRLPNGA